MKSRNTLFSTLLLLSLILAACAPAATPEAMMSHDTPTVEAMMSHDTPTAEAMMSHDTPTADAMMSDDSMMGATDATPVPSMGEMANWLDTSLYDVQSGKNFKVSDFSGKVVLIETMAVWCSNCYQQQKQIEGLHQSMGDNPDFVSLSLDIDSSEDSDTLKKYVDANPQFDWLYAVSPQDLTRTIGNDYGAQFLNPPSTPILILDRHGVAHPLPFGIKSADDLMKAVQPYLDASM